MTYISDRPITYLYSTLHFYERKLRNRPPSKKRLVTAVCGALSDMRPPNWALTEQYQQYTQMTDADATLWNPELSYYISIMRRFIDSKLAGRFDSMNDLSGCFAYLYLASRASQAFPDFLDFLHCENGGPGRSPQKTGTKLLPIYISSFPKARLAYPKKLTPSLNSTSVLLWN